MKVIKRGNPPKPFHKKMTCEIFTDKYGVSYSYSNNEYCGSVLEVDENDIRIIYSQDSLIREIGYHVIAEYGVVCPVCGAFLPIDKDELTSKALFNAKEIVNVNNTWVLYEDIKKEEKSVEA